MPELRESLRPVLTGSLFRDVKSTRGKDEGDFV